MLPIWRDAESLSSADGRVHVQEWRTQVCVFLNGKKFVLEDVQPEVTLLEFIRSTGLTGSKLGCGEV